MLNLDKNLKWTLITIVDPKCLPGESIFDMITTISKSHNFNYVVLDYIYGASKQGLIKSLQEKQNIVLQLDDFLKIVPDVVQFDWGDFFLFSEYPKHWSNPKGELYPFVVEQTDTTVRAVDDGYIYVYTPYQDIVNVITENYKIESMQTDSLINLEYPE